MKSKEAVGSSIEVILSSFEMTGKDKIVVKDDGWEKFNLRSGL